ncbi:hypothetical protein GVAV_001293 [Gurleya vavrai]
MSSNRFSKIHYLLLVVLIICGSITHEDNKENRLQEMLQTFRQDFFVKNVKKLDYIRTYLKLSDEDQKKIKDLFKKFIEHRNLLLIEKYINKKIKFNKNIFKEDEPIVCDFPNDNKLDDVINKKIEDLKTILNNPKNSIFFSKKFVTNIITNKKEFKNSIIENFFDILKENNTTYINFKTIKMIFSKLYDEEQNFSTDDLRLLSLIYENLWTYFEGKFVTNLIENLNTAYDLFSDKITLMYNDSNFLSIFTSGSNRFSNIKNLKDLKFQNKNFTCLNDFVANYYDSIFYKFNIFKENFELDLDQLPEEDKKYFKTALKNIKNNKIVITVLELNLIFKFFKISKQSYIKFFLNSLIHAFKSTKNQNLENLDLKKNFLYSVKLYSSELILFYNENSFSSAIRKMNQRIEDLRLKDIKTTLKIILGDDFDKYMKQIDFNINDKITLLMSLLSITYDFVLNCKNFENKIDNCESIELIKTYFLSFTQKYLNFEKVKIFFTTDLEIDIGIYYKSQPDNGIILAEKKLLDNSKTYNFSKSELNLESFYFEFLNYFRKVQQHENLILKNFQNCLINTIDTNEKFLKDYNNAKKNSKNCLYILFEMEIFEKYTKIKKLFSEKAIEYSNNNNQTCNWVPSLYKDFNINNYNKLINNDDFICYKNFNDIFKENFLQDYDNLLNKSYNQVKDIGNEINKPGSIKKKESYSEEYMLLEFALQFALIDEPVSKKFLIDIIDIMVDKNKELIDLKIMFENPFDFQKLNVGNKDELIKILKEYFDELNEIKKAFYTNHKPKIQIKNLASAKTFDSKASQLNAGIKDTLSLPEAVENENFINKESFLNDESKDSIVENIEKESNFFINSKHNQIDNSKEKITQTSEKAKPIEELELKTSENEAKYNQPTKISNVILNELDILVAKQDLNSFVKKKESTHTKDEKKDENSVGPNLVTKEKETAKELHNGSKFTNLNTKEISEKQIEPAFIYKKESTIHKNAQKEKAKKQI